MITPPDPNPTPMSPLERDLAHLKSLVHWLVTLLVVNLAVSLYCADFVHQIEDAIHQVGG